MKLALLTALSSASRGSNGQILRVAHRDGARGGKPRPSGRYLQMTPMDVEFSMGSDALDVSPFLASTEEVAAYGSKSSKKDQGACPLSISFALLFRPDQDDQDEPVLVPGPTYPPPQQATLTCGDNVLGSTVGQPSGVRMPCDGFSWSSGAVWHKLTGLSGRVALSMCDNRTDYDSALAVAKVNGNEYGGIPVLECLGYDDIECGFRSYVEFDAEAGTDYWARVHGYEGVSSKGDPEGNYSLSVECDLNTTSILGHYSNATQIRGREQQRTLQRQKKEDEELRV